VSRLIGESFRANTTASQIQQHQADLLPDGAPQSLERGMRLSLARLILIAPLRYCVNEGDGLFVGTIDECVPSW
jgi:hypothetical protein